MKRIWHHYKKWEDYQAGMWRKVSDQFERRDLIRRAIDFTGNSELYGEWMLMVLERWPISCEHNLSDLSQNRKAWIGHAATQLAINCPEDLTRSAWGCLTKKQQYDANEKAGIAIEKWESLREK